MSAMLEDQNKKMAATLVDQNNPPRIELYFNANNTFCWIKSMRLLVTWMKTLYITNFDYLHSRVCHIKKFLLKICSFQTRSPIKFIEYCMVQNWVNNNNID